MKLCVINGQLNFVTGRASSLDCGAVNCIWQDFMFDVQNYIYQQRWAGDFVVSLLLQYSYTVFIRVATVPTFWL